MNLWSTRFGHDRVRRRPEVFRVFTFSVLLVYGVVMASSSVPSSSPSSVDTNLDTPVMGTVMVRRMALSMRLAGILSLGGLSSGGASETRFNGVLTVSAGTSGVKALLLFGTSACRFGVEKSIRDYGLHAFEYPWLMGLATLGLLVVVSANDLISRYLGLEWQSLCLYVLAAFRRGSAYSTEAGLKYFIMGAVSSGFYVRGSGMVYGSTGTFSFGEISRILRDSGSSVDVMLASDPSLVMGMCRILVMRLFKLAAVPFHAWILDVYEGAPSPTTRYFASVPKLAILYVRLHRCYGPFANLASVWQPMRRGCAVASRRLSPRMALSQRRVKRFLAASAMGHVGYRLLAVSSLSLEGVQAARLYMIIYMVTSINVWLSVMGVQRVVLDTSSDAAARGDADSRKLVGAKYLTDFGGMGVWNPFLAATVTVSMLSMAGVPPMGGFFAKMWVFFSTMSQGLFRFSVFAVLASCVGAFYYLRVLKLMYFETGHKVFFTGEVDRGSSRVMGMTLGRILVRVFCPGPRRLRTHRMALALCM